MNFSGPLPPGGHLDIHPFRDDIQICLITCWVSRQAMKGILSILLLAGSRLFAADDTNLSASGEWSKPISTQYGHAVWGRLLICETPDHARSEPRTDTAVYLELQEFSSAVRSVRVYCVLDRMSLPLDAPGLRCELRDSSGKLIPDSPGGFSGGGPVSCWVTLQPYCSARIRASVFGGGCLDDGGLAVYLASRGWWDVHPSKTNEYYLSGTFTAAMPTNQLGLQTGLPSVDSTNMDVWYGTLTLPRVKVPLKKP
jgi:hypothetical protein